MSASMTENFSRRLMNPGMSRVHRDIADDYQDLRRPRKVRFFVNGDRFFKGKKLSITPQRYYNFNDLLNDLTGKLPSSLNLPYGVRQIFTPVGGRRVSDIHDLQDGETYVCAGFEGFKVIKYGRTDLEPWTMGKQVRLTQDTGDAGSEAGSYANYKDRGYNAFHPGRYYRSNAAQGNPSTIQRRWPGTFGNQQRPHPGPNVLTGPGEAIPMKPKVITIIRNGSRPRDHVKILLNRRSVQSYEQLMSDISEAFGSKWKNSRVQKLYSVRGKEVKGVSDFFREDDCFIAFGNERFIDSDMADVMDELFPDSAYAKLLLKEWERQRRRDKKANNAAVGKDSEGDKRDSGFGDGSGDNASHDNEGQSTQRSYRSKRAAALASERESLAADSGSPQGYYMLSKLERERKQAAHDQREKARRRQSRLAERERKALEEERRQRGLAPLNPLKPLDDIQRREPKDREQIQRQKEEDARRKIEEEKEAERIRKLKEEREKAEKAARERMAAAEKAAEKERERQEKEYKEREEEEAKKVEQESPRTEIEEQKKVQHEATDSTTKTEGKESSVKKEKATEEEKDTDKDKDKENVKEEPEKKRKKDNAADKDKDKEKNTHRKPKAKVIRRSRAERQISSDNFVMERYELGKALGDGNFAIVKMSRQKVSGQEFAMKVIDKPKLKGKEHMVENEIDVMKDCNHPNIVKLYEEFETKDKIYLVMELVKGGDLFDAITQSVKFGEVDSASMVKDMCNALYYLHSRSIIHRDLKPENLLVHRNKDGTITLKLADFGLAMEVTENIFTVCGTPTYVAPEILTEIGYGLEVDMWAVGVITYILLCGFPPFRSPDRNQTELFEFIKAGEYEFLSPYWDNVSDAAKDLIRRLLVVDKNRRYTAIDVLSHPWVVCGGNPHKPLPGIPSLGAYCKEVKKDLEEQARHNYLSYQKLKERKHQEG